MASSLEPPDGEGRVRRLSAVLLAQQCEDSKPTSIHKSVKIGYFEVGCDGKTAYKEMELRKLSNYVNLLINIIDAAPTATTGAFSVRRCNKDDIDIPPTVAHAPASRKLPRRHSVVVKPSESTPSHPDFASASGRQHSAINREGGPPLDGPPTIQRDPRSARIDFSASKAAHNIHRQSASKTKLSHRDLRRLDWHYNPSCEPLLLVRRHCILLSLHPFRALIMAKRVFVLEPSTQLEKELFHELFAPVHQALLDWATSAPAASSTVSQEKSSSSKSPPRKLSLGNIEVMSGLPSHSGGALCTASRSRASSVVGEPEEFPFEFHCMEMFVTTALATNDQYVRMYGAQLADTVASFQFLSSTRSYLLSSDRIEMLKIVANRVKSLQDGIVAMKTSLDELAEEDDELALMNLTLLERAPGLYTLPLRDEIVRAHERVEELLEGYLIDLNRQVMQLHNMQAAISSAEEKHALQLDVLQNKVLIASTLITLLACCVSTSGVVAGMFGMNLNFTLLERIPFVIVLGVSLGSIVCLYGVAKRWLVYVGFIPATVLVSKRPGHPS